MSMSQGFGWDPPKKIRNHAPILPAAGKDAHFKNPPKNLINSSEHEHSTAWEYMPVVNKVALYLQTIVIKQSCDSFHFL